MPAAKKRPPLELEPGEGKAHEMGETPAEEVREGSEPDDAPKAKHSRKRSAKNAKHTTPAADGYGMKQPMDAECGCGGKASCDGNCGGYGKKMDRNDALSPQEYLAACDLGIQHRSRAYIRARLDAAERLDLKCGKGSISAGEKCTKGAAQSASQPTLRDLSKSHAKTEKFWKTAGSTQGLGNKIKRAGEFAANVGAGVAVAEGFGQVARGAISGNFGEISRGIRNVSLGHAASSLAASSRASRQGNKRLSREFASQAGKLAAFGVGQEAALGAVAGFKRAGGVANVKRGAQRMYQGARMRASGVRSMKRDSVYAAGFSPELDQLAI
jgi:hypothetical protein